MHKTIKVAMVALAVMLVLLLVPVAGAASLIKAVNVNYSPELSLLEVEVQVEDLGQVGDVVIQVGGNEYLLNFAGGKFARAIAGIQVGSELTLKLLDFDEDELERATYILNEEGNLDLVEEGQDVDVSLLEEAITHAQGIHDNAVEGEEPGQYPPGSKAILQEAISAAQSVAGDPQASQAEVNAAVTTLNTAVTQFQAQRVVDTGTLIKSVTGSYSASLSLLEIQVEVEDPSRVGDVFVVVSGEEYGLNFAGGTFQRAVAGIKVGDQFIIKLVGWDGNVLEENAYTLINEAGDLQPVDLKDDPVTVLNIKPAQKVYVKAGDEVEISFRSNVEGGEASFRFIVPLPAALSVASMPLHEDEDEPGFYTASWTVPGGMQSKEVIVEVEIYCGEGKRGQAYAPGRIVIDTLPPAITLVGDPGVYLVVGEGYEEPGATAEDNISGDLTGELEISKTVNTELAGIYTVNYKVSDQAGNVAQAYRRVTVAPPAVTAEGIMEAPESGSIKVTGALEGATLTLYDASDQVSAEMTPETGSDTHTFQGVSPGEGYYVIQALNEVESAPSNTVFLGLLGDVNQDGRVTIMDAVLVLRYTVGLEELTPWQQALADYNRDGRITVMDAREIALLIVER